VLAIIGSVAEIIGTALTPDLPAKTAVLYYADYAIPLVIAIAALAAGVAPRARWLQFTTLGLWFIAFSWVPADILDVPVFHPFSGGVRRVASFMFGDLGDLLGAIAAILLLVALRRAAPRGGWARPRVVPVLLMVGALAGWVVWHAVEFHEITISDGGVSGALKQDYPSFAYSIAGIIVAVVVALVALGISDRQLGGALLVGWSVSAFFYFLAFVTAGWSFGGGPVALNFVAGALIVATGVLAIVYTRLRG
jgi:hypothetical protein